MENQTAAPRSEENLLLGTLGAVLFALVGGVVYYVLWSINIIAALSGIICVLCAIKGYEIFSRRSTKRGIAISVAVSAVVLILAWYVCFCTDLQAHCQALYEAGEAETVPSLGLCLRYGLLELPANPGYLVDLVLSLAMAALGCGGYVTRALRMQEAREARMAEQNRTMELARIQAEQAARAAKAGEDAADDEGSNCTAHEEADT